MKFSAYRALMVAALTIAAVFLTVPSGHAVSGSLSIPATADLFAAGQSTVPDLDGGGGTLPPSLPVTSGEALRISASGTVDCGGNDPSGPDGSAGGGIVDIQSYGGISGFSARGGVGCGLHLSGVFTASSAPVSPPPARLDFVNGAGEGFTSISPLLNQGFFVGDGLTGTDTGFSQTFFVPDGATTFWLGFIDGQTYTSPPGYYNDNTGSLSVQVTSVERVIRAGDFNRVFDELPPPPGAVGSNIGSCTAGFAVVKGATRYMLTANHCRAWHDQNGNEVGMATRVDIKGPMPPAIFPGLNTGLWLFYATGLDCSVGSGDGSCLPGSGSGPSIDVMAWRPDPGRVIPTGEVQTHHGAFQVLGEATWTAGQPICQVGAFTGGEACGYILKKGALDKKRGYVAWQYPVTSQHLEEGDSGGPVYEYKYDPNNGSIIGVKALGINVAYTCNKQETVCTNYFLPIAAIKQKLGVTVLIAP